MAEEKLTNRWLMVVMALVLQLCLGVLYAWSVFRAPMMKELGYTVKEVGYPFMASLFFFAVGMIFAGRWQDKAGPRKVAIFGGLLLGVGAILSGVLYKTIGGLVFAYGILGGLGVGFAYVTPIATCIKWFPDMRGTITGLAVFGFGAGTLVFGPLINKLIASVGLANTFYILGVIFIICVCGAGSFFKVPPPGYKPAGWSPPAPAAGGLGIMALLNGLGRLAHGSISDKLGRQKTVMLMFAQYILAFVLILPNADSFLKWLVGICIVGFAYGGYLALMPSMTADYFGTKSLGQNYGYLFTAWGVAGLG